MVGIGSHGLLRFLIMGAPGSGKGTISARVVRDFPIKHLASGDLLRAQIEAKTPQGEEAGQFITKGQLVPDDLVTLLTLTELQKYNETNWLLDGYPRTVAQSKSLLDFCSLTKVLDLQVPHDEIINRIKGRLIHLSSGRVYNTDYRPPKRVGLDDLTGELLIQRQDDKPAVVEARLKGYKNQSDPILSFYRQKGLIKTFTGTKSDEIYAEVKEFMGHYFELKYSCQRIHMGKDVMHRLERKIAAGRR